METFFIKPNYDIVRDPASFEALPKDGAYVPKNAYWLRRLRDGDVSLAKATKGQKVKGVNHAN